MFSKISQIGKTFTDELSRINDEVNNSPLNEQKQIADPEVARKVIQTKTPEISEITTPSEMQKPDDVSPKISEEEEQSSVILEESAKPSQLTHNTKNDKNPNSIDLVPGTEINFSSLQPEICSRLKKFIKYEAKYPQLYDAYKIEKKKTALIHAFENMLQEQTPCSSIGELDSVRDYLKSLDSKSKMLSAELNNVTKEKKTADDKVVEMSKKIKDLQKALTSRRTDETKELKKLKDEVFQLKEKNLTESKLSDDYDALLKENEKLKIDLDNLEKANVLTEQSEELHNTINQLKKDNEIFEKEKQDSELKIKSLMTEFDDFKEVSATEKTELKAKHDILEKKLHESILSGAKNDEYEKRIKNLDLKVSELEKSLESSNKLNTLFKQKVESLTSAKPIENPTNKKVTNNKSKKDKGKKKKQNNSKTIVTATEEPQNLKSTETIDPEINVTDINEVSSNDVEVIELKHKLDELELKYNDELIKHAKLEKNIKDKDSEIEDLKDMLRDIGDSLVESEKKNKDTGDLSSLLKSTKEELDSKLNELEILRIQNANALTDYEKTKSSLSKKLDTYMKQITDLESQMNAKTSELVSVRKINDDLSKKLKENEGLLNKLKENEKKYETDIQNLKNENSKLLIDLENSKQKVETDKNSKGEIQFLKAQLSRKERVLTEAESKVKFLQEEKNKINESMIELKVQNKEMKSKSNTSVEEMEKLTKSNEKLKSEYNENTLKINKLSLENTKLLKQVEELRDQYNLVKHFKSTSNDQVESYKKKVEELMMGNKEYENKIDMIQEELSQSRNMLQERTREMSTMRKLLMETEDSSNTDRKELKMKFDRLLEEKEQSNNESLIIIKSRQLEIDDLKRKQSELTNKIDLLENQNLKLDKELKNIKETSGQTLTVSAKSSTTSLKDQDAETEEYNSKLIDSLRDSLNRTENRLREIESANTKLRTANQDASEKLVRLNKKYKIILQQYKRRISESSASSSRHNSFIGNLTETSIQPDLENVNAIKNNDENEDEDVKEKSIYIKNVLLGFLEHKEQRQMLLPVIKMLLYMSDDDAKKLNDLLI